MNRLTPEAINPIAGNIVDAARVQARRLSHFVVDAAIDGREATVQGAREKLDHHGQSAMISLNGLRMHMLDAKAEKTDEKMERHEFKTEAKADAAKKLLGRQDLDPASVKALLNNHGRGILDNSNPYRPTSTKERLRLQKIERKQRKVLAEQSMNLYNIGARGRQERDYHVHHNPIMSPHPRSADEIKYGYGQLTRQFDDTRGTTRKHNLSRGERWHLRREKRQAAKIFEESEHFAHELHEVAHKTTPDSMRYKLLEKRRERALERAQKHETKSERRRVSLEQNDTYSQLMSEQRQHDRKQRKEQRGIAHEQSALYASYLKDQRQYSYAQHGAASAERAMQRRATLTEIRRQSKIADQARQENARENDRRAAAQKQTKKTAQKATVTPPAQAETDGNTLNIEDLGNE